MRRSRGFTLLELLVVIIIISLLASMVMFALFRAQQSASQAKTKAMIVKIHNVLARHWDTYQTRRVPVTVPAGWTPRQAAELRLVALRRVMRWELPDRWEEVKVLDPDADGNIDLRPLKRVDAVASDFSPAPYLNAPPGLAHVYFNYYHSVSVGIAPDDLPTVQFQNAECLYMIVTRGLADEADGLQIFSDDEIGDIDRDGAKEFLDAWGTPIRFLRWPVGFVDDPQQDAGDYPFGHLSDLQPPKETSAEASKYLACVPNALDEHDPFDPAYVDKIDLDDTDPTNRESYAFRVFPLVYSAGPDRVFDIYAGVLGDVPEEQKLPINDPFGDYRNSADVCATYDPATSTPPYIGSPADLPSYVLRTTANGRLEHYDNIHNHLIDTSLR